MRVIDYSFARPGPAQIRQAGAAGVMRYLSTIPGGKNITAAELEALHGAGLGVGLYIEDEAGWMHDGYDRGARVASQCEKTARTIGFPAGRLYAACDYDATLKGRPVSPTALDNMSRVVQCLNGVASVIGADNVGLYGDSYVLDFVAVHSPYRHFIQTEAWSYGTLSPVRSMLQYARAATIDGGAVDLCDTYGPDWQPRLPAGTLPAPAPAGIDVRRLQRLLHAADDGVWGTDTDRRAELVRHRGPDIRALQGVLDVPTDGVFGPVTARAYAAVVKALQRLLGVPADGVWGTVTDRAYIAASPRR